MTPKEIGRSASRIFKKAIPENCAIRDQEDQEDYGIDYELELTDKEDHATGFIFKMQQKGVATLKTNADDKTVSYSEPASGGFNSASRRIGLAGERLGLIAPAKADLIHRRFRA
jgi:hypothetical protein